MSNSLAARVLFFIGSMGGGGAERQVVEIMKRLDRKRFAPQLYLHHRKGELLDEIPKDVPVHSFWENFSGTFRSKWHHIFGTTDKARWGHLKRVIEAEKIEFVYCQTYLAAIDASAACAAAKIPLISMIVGLPLLDIELYCRGDRAAELQKARKAFAAADLVVANSRGVRESLTNDLSVPSHRCLVHHCMMDVESAIRRSGEEISPLPKDRLKLLTVGRLSPEKGHREFLDVLEILANKSQKPPLWCLLGKGPLEDELKARIAERGLQSFVHFVGFQKNPYAYYRQADLLVVPSLYEGFGLVMAESLAYRLPVVAYDAPTGPREVLDNGRLGRLIPPQNSHEMAAAILDFQQNPDPYHATADAGEEFVRNMFSFEVGMPQLEKMFTSVLT